MPNCFPNLRHRSMFSLMGNCMHCIADRRRPLRKLVFVMVGLDNAGKTCVASALKGEIIDNVAPTIGFSSVQFKYKRCNVVLYDLGGGKNIRNIWRNYFSEVYGLIYVIDASDTDRLFETKRVLKDILSNPRVAGKPVLILANKQDKEGALDEIDLCEHLELETLANSNKCPTRVETCSIMLGQGKKLDRSIHDGFQWIIEEVRNDYDTYEKRVDHETSLQREAEEREKKERVARVRKERERREKEEGNQNDSGGGGEERDFNPFKPISEAIAATERKPPSKKKKKLRGRNKNKVLPAIVGGPEVGGVNGNVSQQQVVPVEIERRPAPPLPLPSMENHRQEEFDSDAVDKESDAHEASSPPKPAPRLLSRRQDATTNGEQNISTGAAREQIPREVNDGGIPTPPTSHAPLPHQPPAHLPTLDDDHTASDTSSVEHRGKKKKKKRNRFQRLNNRTEPLSTEMGDGDTEGRYGRKTDGGSQVIGGSGDEAPHGVWGGSALPLSMQKLPALTNVNGSAMRHLPPVIHPPTGKGKEGSSSILPLQTLQDHQHHHTVDSGNKFRKTLTSTTSTTSSHDNIQLHPAPITHSSLSSKWGLVDELPDVHELGVMGDGSGGVKYGERPNSDEVDVVT